MRQDAECRYSTWAKMQFMNRENVLNFRSFWQIQIVGWCCFYLFNLLESIHNFLTQRVSIKEQTVPIFFMFLGSCALRPFCRRLLRQSQSWIAFELKAAAAAMVTSIPVACAACLILESFEHVPWHALVTVWAWSFFTLFMWCSLYFSIKQWQQSRSPITAPRANDAVDLLVAKHLHQIIGPLPVGPRQVTPSLPDIAAQLHLESHLLQCGD